MALDLLQPLAEIFQLLAAMSYRGRGTPAAQTEQETCGVVSVLGAASWDSARGLQPCMSNSALDLQCL